MPDKVEEVAHDPQFDGSDDSEDEDYDPSTIKQSKSKTSDQLSESSGSDAEDILGEYDSGDEKTIGAPIPSKKRKRTQLPDKRITSDELGTEGGLVKTRAQRAQEQDIETAVAPAPVTSSNAIDAIWAAMNSPSTTTAQSNTGPQAKERSIGGGDRNKSTRTEPETIKITRTYKFAGETHKEEKTVLKDSQSARDYVAAQSQLQQQQQQQPETCDSAAAASNTLPPLRRPMKRKSKLEEAYGRNAASKKLNTLEKSRIEWSGFVDEQGINEELKHGNKAGYLDKQDFLGRSEAARYDSWKAGQKK